MEIGRSGSKGNNERILKIFCSLGATFAAKLLPQGSSACCKGKKWERLAPSQSCMEYCTHKRTEISGIYIYIQKQRKSRFPNTLQWQLEANQLQAVGPRIERKTWNTMPTALATENTEITVFLKYFHKRQYDWFNLGPLFYATIDTVWYGIK